MVILLVLLFNSQNQAVVVATNVQPAAGDRIIIKLEENQDRAFTPVVTGDDSLDELMQVFAVQSAESLFQSDHGHVELKQHLGLDRIYILTLPSDSAGKAVDAFASHPAVEYAEPDFLGHGAGWGSSGRAPSDASFIHQWSLQNNGQTGGLAGADITAVDAWRMTGGISTTILAIIDSGVDLDHPDLATKIVPGYDFVNHDPVPQDDHGHGTHVAGIAAAVSDNAIGIAGVCWECRIMPLKALDSTNYGFYTWWAAAIAFAVDNGAHVINMSMGGLGQSSFLRDAVRYAYLADVPIVVSMMNDGNNTLYYPAAYPETIAVGSSNHSDHRSAFSNYGNHLDLIAPGSAILSTMRNDTYATWSGTSMAAPHVSGVLGLIRSEERRYTVEQLRTLLRITADDGVGPRWEDTPGWDPYFGAGRLNAASLVYQAMPPLERVTVHGPALGLTDTLYTFTAAVEPLTTSQPITYVWEVAGYGVVTQATGLIHTITVQWTVTGTQPITVTAINSSGSVTGTHSITLLDFLEQLFLPVTVNNQQSAVNSQLLTRLHDHATK